MAAATEDEFTFATGAFGRFAAFRSPAPATTVARPRATTNMRLWTRVLIARTAITTLFYSCFDALANLLAPLLEPSVSFGDGKPK